MLRPLEQAGKAAVIPPKANRKGPRPYDRDLYKARHLIENFFAKLKQYRAIATRYDKRAVHFLGAIHLAAAVVWLKRGHALLDGRLPSGYRNGRSSQAVDPAQGHGRVAGRR